MELSPSMSVMAEGRSLLLLSGTPDAVTSKRIFLWWEPAAQPTKLGAIHFNDHADTREKVKVEGQTLQMNKISDVFSGKQQPLLKSAAASEYPSDRCLTLGSKVLSLHLVADSSADRQAWIQGIKDVFQRGQAAKKAEKEKAAAAANGNGAAHATSTTAGADATATAAPSTSTSAPSSTPTNVLADGGIYRRVVLKDGAATVSDIFLWHDPSQGKLGTLYWGAAAGEKTPVEGQSMPVTKIRDVFLGRQTPELKHEVSKEFPSNRCFSLVQDKEKGIGLHLIAQDEQHRNATLATIKGFWANPKKKTVEKAKEATREAQQIGAEQAAGAVAQQEDLAAQLLAEKKRKEEEEAKAKAAAEAEEAKKAQEAAEAYAAAQASAALAPPADTVIVTMAPVEGATVTAASPDVPAPTTAAAPHSSSLPPTSPTAAAKKLAAEVAAEPQVNIAAMQAGANFKRWTLDGSSQPPVDVFVFLSQEGGADGPIGSLYFNEGLAADKTKSSDRQLPLHAARDIYVGLHAWKRAGVDPSPLSSTRALSVVSSSLPLHLEAADDLTRARWATGIRNVFEQAHKKADEAKKAQEAATPIAAAQPTPTPSDDAYTSAVTLLSSGSDFTSHTPNSDRSSLTARPVFLWYDRGDEKLGTLYWCEPGQRTKVPGQSIPLNKVSDVYLGKHASIRDCPEAAALRTAHCFTLASKHVQVNLEARDAQHRTSWINAIKAIFNSAGRKVDEKKVAKRDVSVATAVAAATTSSGHKVHMPEVPTSPRREQDMQPTVVVTPISQGQDFDIWELNEARTHSSSRRAHVWFEADGSRLGALYWSFTPGQKQKVEGQSLPLHEISDVLVGAHSEEFQHPSARTVLQSDRCITLRSQINPDHNLNLAADSAQAQRRWIRGLKRQFSEHPDTVVETRPVKSGETPVEALSSPKSQRVQRARILALKQGQNIVAVYEEEEGSEKRVRCEDSVLWLEETEGRAGTLYWSQRGSQQKDANHSLGVHAIRDVWMGKKQPVFKSPSLAHVAAPTAFSVATKVRQLHAYTATEEERRRILEGIEAAIRAAGTPIREQGAKPAASPRSAASKLVSDSQLLGQLYFIRHGTGALLHHTKGQPPKQIFLWYEPSEGKQGALLWTEGERRTSATPNRMLLQYISDVFVGRRQSDILRAATAAAASDLCFALRTTSGQRLDLQLSSKEDRDHWLSSLRTIFTSTHKRVVDGGSGQGRAAPASSFKPGQVVDTFFGRGVVDAPTRADGITRVDVQGTPCYFNQEAIKTVPLLYTPYGVGVAPRTAEERQDGIKRVDLPWAVAYLNSASYSEKPLPSAESRPQSREQALAYLQAGQRFLLVSASGKTEDVFVHLNVHSSRLGSLDFKPVASPTSASFYPSPSSSASIPLKEISDIALGKQSAELAQMQADTPDTCVFAIVRAQSGGNQRTYSFLAMSDAARSDFISSLLNILSATGRSITQQAPGSSPQAVSSPDGRSGNRRYSFAKPVLPSVEEAERTLSDGEFFRLLLVAADGVRTEVPRAAVTLLTSGSEDKLYWSPATTGAAPSRDPHRCMALADLRQVWYGRRSALLVEPAFSTVPSDRCFSMEDKNKMQWNFIADSKEARDRFFFSLQAAVDPKHRAAKKRAAAAAAAAASSPLGADNLVARGCVLTRWFSESDGSVRSERVFLFHEMDGTRYGSLYWNFEEGDRTRSPARCLPLHIVRDVWQGRNTAVTRSPAMSHVPKEVLLSLVSAPKDGSAPVGLHLQMESNQHRAAYLKDLKKCWDVKSGKKSSSSPAGQQAEQAVSSPAPVPVAAPAPVSFSVTGPPLSVAFLSSLSSTSTRSLVPPPAAAVGFLQHGATFTRDGAEVDLFYVAAATAEEPFGNIYVADKGSRQMSEEQQLPLHCIERIQMEENSFTLESAAQKLSVRSDSPALVAAWVSGLNYLLAAAGFRLTQTETNTYVVDDRAAQAQAAVPLRLPTSSASAVLQQGQSLTALFPSFNGVSRVLNRAPVSVFVEGETLWYCPPNQRVKEDEEERAFPLRKLQRIQTGGKNGLLTFTLVTADNRLELEAASVPTLSLCLESLSALLQAAGRTPALDKSASDEQKRVYLLAEAQPTAAVSAAASPSAAAAALSAFTADGATVSAYSLRKGSQLVHKPLTLWLSTGEDGSSLLNWGSPEDEYVALRLSDPECDNQLYLSDLTAVSVGKDSPALQALTDEQVQPDRCVAIQAGTIKLELVAENEQIAKAIVQAIQSKQNNQ